MQRRTKLLWHIRLITLSFFMISASFADNLSTCLSGKFPTLCNKAHLTDTQRSQADSAERIENSKICLTGKYPSLCKKGLLTPSESKAAVEAERRENLAVCMDGRYPSLCSHSSLSKDDALSVNNAEKNENLKTCLIGRYPALCNKKALTNEQRKQVDEAEKKVKTELNVNQPIRRNRGGCDSGHWVDEVLSNGAFVKLEDGSVWKIDPIDQVDTMLWLPTTDITVCQYLLINTEDNEKAGAFRVK